MNRLFSKQKCLPNRLFVTLLVLVISPGVWDGLAHFLRFKILNFIFFSQINEYFGV